MVIGSSQAHNGDSPSIIDDFSSRLREAMHDLPPATLARRCGFRPQLIDKYLKGTMPGADKAVRLAQELDVPLEWLVTGRVRDPSHSLIAADQADWVFIPHLRLAEFTETAKPEPAETVPIRRDWLNRNIYTSTNLFITELPAHQIEGIGFEGDPVLCRDAAHHNEEGVYLYLWDGLPVIRRFEIPAPGQLGETQKSWQWQVDEPSGPRLVARVLANMKVRPL